MVAKLCVDCEFGEFCLGKDCKCQCHQRVFVRKFDAALEHAEQLNEKRKAKGR